MSPWCFHWRMEGAEHLSDLDRELLERCSMDTEGGETTKTLYVEMLESPPDRASSEATLRDLVEKKQMTPWRATFGPSQRTRRTRHTSHVVYEDAWWPVTDRGRAAI